MKIKMWLKGSTTEQFRKKACKSFLVTFFFRGSVPPYSVNEAMTKNLVTYRAPKCPILNK